MTDDRMLPPELAGTRLRVLVATDRSDDVMLVAEALDRHGIDVSMAVVRPDGERAGLMRTSVDLLALFNIDAGAATRDLIRAARSRSSVVVTRDVSPASARRFLESGVDAIVAEEEASDILPLVLPAVLAGQICVPREVRDAVEPPALSRRERQVLALIAGGLSNQEIARELFLSESTVKSHVASAFRRLGVRSRREAVAVVLGSSETLRRSVLMSHPLERHGRTSTHGRAPTG